MSARRIKKRVNVKLGSRIVEEKSYQAAIQARTQRFRVYSAPQ